MNFTPQSINTQNILNRTKINKLYCKNFMFTILVLELFNYNNTLKILNLRLFFFKKKKTIGSILRAPYKNKTAQFNICINRYFLILTFNVKIINRLLLYEFTSFKNLNEELVKSYNYFESAMITQISRTIFIPINIKIL